MTSCLPNRHEARPCIIPANMAQQRMMHVESSSIVLDRAWGILATSRQVFPENGESVLSLLGNTKLCQREKDLVTKTFCHCQYFRSRLRWLRYCMATHDENFQVGASRTGLRYKLRLVRWTKAWLGTGLGEKVSGVGGMRPPLVRQRCKTYGSHEDQGPDSTQGGVVLSCGRVGRLPTEGSAVPV